jgi:hypothetical protein
MSTTRRVFPEVFKREAVDRVISSGLSVGKVATELGPERDGAETMGDAAGRPGDRAGAALDYASAGPVAV